MKKTLIVKVSDLKKLTGADKKNAVGGYVLFPRMIP